MIWQRAGELLSLLDEVRSMQAQKMAKTRTLKDVQSV